MVDAGPWNMDNHRMKAVIHEIQGYAVVLDKVAFVTRVFEAEEGEGYQFNIRFVGEMRLAPKFPTRHEADLQRRLLIQALGGEILVERLDLGLVLRFDRAGRQDRAAVVAGHLGIGGIRLGRIATGRGDAAAQIIGHQ